MSVAESTEILRPIFHFGCAQASSGVTLSKRASAVLRNGPPEAVRITRVTPRAAVAGQIAAGHALENRVVLAVDGNESASRAAHLVHQQPAGHDQRFLVGEQHALAGAHARRGSAASRRPRRWPPSPSRHCRRSPAAASASLPLSTRSAEPAFSSAARACAAAAWIHQHHGVGLELAAPARRWFASCRGRPAPRRGSARDAARSRSSVLRPMLPVEPRIATPRGPLMRAPRSRTGRARTAAPPRLRCRCDPAGRRVPAAACPLSLSPAARLNMLSVRSPTTGKNAHAASESHARRAPAGRNGRRRPTRTSATIASPPSAPSQVLPGLTRGASLRLPNAAPCEVRADVRRDHQEHAATARSCGPRTLPVMRAIQAREREERGHQHRHAANQRELRLVPLGREQEPAESDQPPHARQRRAVSPGGPDRRSSASSTAAAARPRRRSRAAPAAVRSPPNPAHSHAPMVNTAPNASTVQRGASTNSPSSSTPHQDRSP